MITHGTASELQVVGKQCPISLAAFKHDDSVSKLECGHSFTRERLMLWILRRPVCPVCRTPITAIQHAATDLEIYRLMLLEAFYGCIDMHETGSAFAVPLSVLARIAQESLERRTN